MDVVGTRGVAELYPLDEGFILGLVVGCLEHELDAVFIPYPSGTFNNETSSIAAFSGQTIYIQIPRLWSRIVSSRGRALG